MLKVEFRDVMAETIPVLEFAWASIETIHHEDGMVEMTAKDSTGKTVNWLLISSSAAEVAPSETLSCIGILFSSILLIIP